MKGYINGYSLALFSIAKEEKKLKQYKDQSILIIDALVEAEGYEEMLSSKSIPVETKKKMIKDAFGKKVNKDILSFLLLLVDRNKIRVAIPALEKLIKLINIETKVHEGVVYTASKLTPKELKDIQKKTESILKMDITLINKIDTGLISGFKVQVEDEIIEDSVSSRLEDIRLELLRKDH